MSEIGHGGNEIKERIISPKEAAQKIKGLAQVPVRSQIANEVIDIAYGYFTPLQGFMGKADVETVCKKMRLADGKTVWSIPILFDLSKEEISKYNVKPGASLLLTYNGNPMAIFEVDEIFDYDKKSMCQDVYGTDEDKHPGCARTYQYKDKFLGGKITLVNRPKINPPYEPYFFPRSNCGRCSKKRDGKESWPIRPGMCRTPGMSGS